MQQNVSRLNLAMDLLLGKREILLLGKEEFELLGIWGQDGFDAYDLTVAPMEELYSFLVNIINEETQKIIEGKKEEQSSLINITSPTENMDIVVMANGEQTEYRLHYGRVYIKRYEKDKYPWIDICGKLNTSRASCWREDLGD